MAMTFHDFIAAKLKLHDMVLGRVSHYAQQKGRVELGRIYRNRFLFHNRYAVHGNEQMSFIGGGSAFGDVGNFEGEVGFLFLAHSNETVYQLHYRGHIPVERQEDGLWCLVYGLNTTDLRELPPPIRENSKPSTLRVNSNGEPADAWVRFDTIESYLMQIIAELDQRPCEPYDLVNPSAWFYSPEPAR